MKLPKTAHEAGTMSRRFSKLGLNRASLAGQPRKDLIETLDQAFMQHELPPAELVTRSRTSDRPETVAVVDAHGNITNNRS